MKFESLGSCDSYIVKDVPIKVIINCKFSFCQYCNQVRYERAFDRYYCHITSEFLFNIKKERGENCPLKELE